MEKYDKIHSVLSRVSAPLADIGAFFLFALMSITVIDVVGRALDILYLRGVLELANMTLVFLAFLTLPQSFIQGGHIFIEIATKKLPARVNQLIDAFWLVITALFLGLIAWCTFKMAIDLYTLEEVSLDLELPLYIFWIPAAIGLTLSFITALWMAFRTFLGIKAEVAEH
jgi:TRAP-type C4-dicarboxylate transport system permease small subunit